MSPKKGERTFFPLASLAFARAKVATKSAKVKMSKFINDFQSTVSCPNATFAAEGLEGKEGKENKV